MNGCSLIDAFINNDGGRITLKEEPEYLPEIDEPAEGEPQEDCLTETLAGIYIKQGRYEKALSIMNRINDSAAKNNPYFADQQRFLKKLIKLSNSQKTKQ
jgi:thioredoxin-like negative regulator of GroEL